jgi:2-polyprenyl-3-methyl-5-hydroxy-6-metoxy-1,4-benzoquinol methylase
MDSPTLLPILPPRHSSSRTEQLVGRVGCLFAQLRQHVSVGVHRDADLGVPEHLHDCSGGDAPGEQESRTSVPRSQGIGACREDTGSTVDGMAQARYDAVADFYISGFESADDPASLALLDLLRPVAGLRVLDVACGHGRITRELARRGADVLGIDISGNLISKARQAEQDEPLGIRYIHADVTVPDVLGGEFDAVACNFGLSDIDDLDAAITAISGALRPRGYFAFSILHPCFAGGKDISGAWPSTGSYYDERRWTAQDAHSTLRRQVGANHRMLSTYLGTLRRHGLWLDQLAEPLPDPDWDQAHDADRKPVFLVARFVRLPQS